MNPPRIKYMISLLPIILICHVIYAKARYSTHSMELNGITMNVITEKRAMLNVATKNSKDLGTFASISINI